MAKRGTFLISACLLLILPLAVAAAQEVEPAAGDVRTDDAGIAQVYVPAGCFLMGITREQAEALAAQNPPGWVAREFSSEQPQREVCLSEGFWMDQYEVTNAAYQAFVDSGGYSTPEHWSEQGQRWLDRQNVDDLPLDCEGDEGPDAPRACITWYEAEAYANWRGGLIPTEAQWEWAARGPDNFAYPWGDEWDPERANVVDSTGVVAVGSYPEGVSWVGAHDMAGNVMEWARNWWTPNYRGAERDDPLGPENGRIKPERGGWWGSNPFVARTTYRHYEDPPSYQDHHIGLRVITPRDAG
ncbi:MAG: formylglycine-generating enzyme family protein [Chloroflexi bacterium]|nr:formylglycine-generating enzyme family protein [Chloroflexota bacterium]